MKTPKNNAVNASPGEENGRLKFGTFAGVFTPSILTILGVIMYLRLGWVVGNVGLYGTLVIVAISSAITFLTALSVSAIATDQKVRTGGAYYMISRSLGLEGGGAIGIPLYIAQAFSVPLYTIGFAESVALAFPGVSQRAVGLAVTVLVAALALKSARIAIKAQYFIMAAIAASFLSLLLGSGSAPDTAAAAVSTPGPAGFWRVFAVFFPAVTGIMAGINMSGDLKSPARSIPLGTLAAVGTGFLIYMSLPVLLYFRAETSDLIADPLIMYRLSRWGGLILAGIWGATLSSAIGSILGAPRVLQALARDGVLPRPLRWLGRGSGPADEPRLGTALTLLIALFWVYTGDLNTIAPILTMFFLTTYLVLNLAAGMEGFLRNPSFRPAFRVHWGFSLLGAGGCIAAMFLINPLASAVAAVLVIAIFFWLKERNLMSNWGDVRGGMWMMLLRASLMQLSRVEDSRNWRPNILVLAGSPMKRWHLIELADMLTNNRGLFTVATVLPRTARDAEQKARMEATLKEFFEKKGIPALVRLISATDPFAGARKLVESYGLGPVVPNTVLLGDTETENPRLRLKYFKLVQEIYRGNRNVLILKQNRDTPLGRRPLRGGAKKIDVWWGGLKGNGGLMLLLADSLRLDPHWRGARLRLKLVVADRKAAAAARGNMEGLLEKLQIRAESLVIEGRGGDFGQIFRESSRDADIVFHGMAEPEEEFLEYYQEITERVRGMPTTVLVLAGRRQTFSGVLEKEE